MTSINSSKAANPRGLSVQQRLLVIVAAATAGIILLATVLLFGMRSHMLEDRKNAARFAVESAWGVVEAFHKRVGTGELTDADARKRAMETLRTLRYNGQDYFWINDFGPRMVMHPTKPELEGKGLSGTKDPDGKALFVEFVRVARSEGAASSITSGRARARARRCPRCPTCGSSSPGAGWSAPASMSMTSMRSS